MNSRKESVRLPPKPIPCGRLKPASLKYWTGWVRVLGVLSGGGGEVSTVQRDFQSTEKSAYHEVSVGRDARAKDFEVWREPKKEATLRAEKTIARLPTNIGVTAEDSAALILDDRQRGPAVALHGVAEAVEREAVLVRGGRERCVRRIRVSRAGASAWAKGGAGAPRRWSKRGATSHVQT